MYVAKTPPGTAADAYASVIEWTQPSFQPAEPQRTRRRMRRNVTKPTSRRHGGPRLPRQPGFLSAASRAVGLAR